MTIEEYLTGLLAPRMGQTVTTQGGAYTLAPDHILLEVTPTGFTACPLSVFLDLFGHAIPEPFPANGTIFDRLTAVDPDDSTGWRRHFEAWKSDGLIS